MSWQEFLRELEMERRAPAPAPVGNDRGPTAQTDGRERLLAADAEAARAWLALRAETRRVAKRQPEAVEKA